MKPSSVVQYSVRYQEPNSGDVLEVAFKLTDYGGLWEPARDAAFRHAQLLHDTGKKNVTVRILKDKDIFGFGEKAL